VVACSRCGEGGLDHALGGDKGLGPDRPRLALADWGALAQRPASPRAFEHVVVVDPPPRTEFEALARSPRAGPGGAAPLKAGFLHLAWGAPELGVAESRLAGEWDLRPAIAEIWRALEAGGGGAEGDALAVLLAGTGHHPRSAEVAARCLRVLAELGLCEWNQDRRSLTIAATARTDLARSPTYRACLAERRRCLGILRGQRPALAEAA
jgi:hypothetical protein